MSAAATALLSCLGVFLYRRSVGKAQYVKGPTAAAGGLARRAAVASLEPFDLSEFQRRPVAYVQTVEPGRCFQTAPPKGADDVRLTVASRPLIVLKPGERSILRVKGAPRAPVTFTSFNGGVFEESRLSSVTVLADGDGIAEARFTVGPGIGGDVRIQAGSPMAVGAQHFVVRVAE